MQTAQRPDELAEVVAAARAMAAREPDVRVRNPDYAAIDFLTHAHRVMAHIPGVPELVLRAWQWRVPGIYQYMNARTHHIDRVLAEDVRRGARQLVLLGAGYDSRPYRLRSL